jgi:hypothetical protein
LRTGFPRYLSFFGDFFLTGAIFGAICFPATRRADPAGRRLFNVEKSSLVLSHSSK